jgi:hypothetical protein
LPLGFFSNNARLAAKSAAIEKIAQLLLAKRFKEKPLSPGEG